MNIDCECQQKHKRPRCGCGVRIASVTIPASLGTSDPGQPNAPENGAYKNAVVRYQADGKVYIYTSEGIPVLLNDGTTGKVISVNGKTGEVVLTSEDVGALPSDTFIPVKVSDLINDSNFQTAQQVAATVAIETDARADADTNLSNRITANAEAIAGETTARQGADANLQSQIDAISAGSDVTDVVGTYAELQAYDTSSLSDKDIIKVLQDETQQNATTYYRWSTTTQSFTLIGTEGPYYTRGEADTLLNAKADKSATYTKTETDNLLATKADQSTTYTKTETNSLLAAKADQSTTYTKTETDSLLATKADQNTTYTKTETDTLLTAKADKSTTYTKTETDSLLAAKADQNTTYTKTETDSLLATKANQNTTYTKTETDTLLATKADQSTTYTKTETDNLLDGKQDVLTAGANVSISGNTISATDTTYTAGTNVSISGNVISATDTTYTAGTGLNLTGTQFSVDTTAIATQSDLTTGLATKQNTLTAGSNVQISNDTISATDTTYNPFTGTDGTAAGTSGLVPAPATTDAGKVLGADGTWVTGGPTVVQTTGTSITDVMSQNATTSMMYDDPATRYRVRIGYDAVSTGGNAGIAIGKNAGAYSEYSISVGTGENIYGVRHSSAAQSPYAIAIGSDTDTRMYSDGSVAMGYNAKNSGGSAQNRKRGQIALGAYSSTSEKGEMNIGSSSVSYGYNNSNYRLLTGLYDPQSAHDAATKGYVDDNVENLSNRILASGTNAPTTSTVGEVGSLYAYVVSGTGHLAICTDATGGNYTWQTLI